MTREEEIIKAGISFTIRKRPMCIGGSAFSELVEEMNRNYAFEAGAKWADEHPYSNGKELLYVAHKTAERTKKEIIINACEWLKQNAENYVVTCYDKGELNDEDLLNDFKKAMEE